MLPDRTQERIYAHFERSMGRLGVRELEAIAQNLRDHVAAITDENPQISARGDSSTVLDEAEEVVTNRKFRTRRMRR